MHCRANTVYTHNTNAYYFLSLHKNLEKLAKDKLDCELVSECLVNQYKWSAASLPDAEMLTRSGKSGHQ